MIMPRELARIKKALEDSEDSAGCDSDAGTIHNLAEAAKTLLREYQEDQNFIDILENENNSLRYQRDRYKRALELLEDDGENIRESVRWFAREMERKLREHDDRPGWENDDPFDLFARLVEEAGELRMMIADNERRLVERCLRGPRGKEIGE